jgi:nicotinamide mononucleotide transporter
MTDFFQFLFKPYADYEPLQILWEAIAVIFGIWSVWLAKKNHVWVFPTGIISTALYVYLLYQWGLLGDMLINTYYTAMSLYGWWVWTRKINVSQHTPIATINRQEKVQLVSIFLATIVFVYLVYQYFDKWDAWVSRIDVLTTAIFFVAMWLMAKRKVEHWIFWIVGDIISIPLYFYKGYTLTSLQYLIFLIIAVYGYRSWKRNLDKHPQIASK